MSRRRIAWLVSLALMAFGSVIAHGLAYRLVAPAHGSHAGMNHPHGHGVFPHLELCLAVCGAGALIALLISVADRAQVTRSFVAPLWVFAVVPPLGFVLQEHLEHLLVRNALPTGAVLEPTFLVGLLLQLPFAVAAFAVARALLALAQAIVDGLKASPRLRLPAPEPLFVPAVTVGPPRISALAHGHGQRAPPAAFA